MSKRQDMAINKDKPGPGSYNNMMKGRSIGCVIGRSKKLERRNESTPGPADYSPLGNTLGTRRTQS